MRISQSLGRKLVVTATAAASFVFFYETTVMD
jgi:hypothetical protein